MHEELDAPDAVCGRVFAFGDNPGGELFGESADVGPFAGAGDWERDVSLWGERDGGGEGGFNLLFVVS